MAQLKSIRILVPYFADTRRGGRGGRGKEEEGGGGDGGGALGWGIGIQDLEWMSGENIHTICLSQLACAMLSHHGHTSSERV